jgi:adenylate cyclase
MTQSNTQIVASSSTGERPFRMLAVLFADVSGSTRLYDTLGDVQAKLMVDECIALMRRVVPQYGGGVIKTIGDEVMCVLPNANNAYLAAIDMQYQITALPEVSGVRRSIRVGFHFGPVIQENNDVFGDTVNLAARMTGLAKGQQIITTGASVAQLAPMLRMSTRPIAALSIKGKGDDVDVYEVIWQGGDELTMAAPLVTLNRAMIKLSLTHGIQTLVLDKFSNGIVMGRDPSCDICVAERSASRHHARIERRRNKYFLIDQSTNGTYILFAGEGVIVLRREEAMLRGSGTISFGDAGGEIIRFSLGA